MRIRRTSEKITLLLFGFLLIALITAGIYGEQGIFASAISNDNSETTDHFVTIYDNGSKAFTVKSSVSTVLETLERLGIEVADEDIVEPALDAEINDADFNINIYRANEVMVIDGADKRAIKTASRSPEAIVADAGVELLAADIVELQASTNILESGMASVYYVQRAKDVKFNYYGKDISVRTQAQTVGEFLAEQNISTDISENWVSVDLSEKVVDDMAFDVMRQGKHTMVQEEDIPYSTKTTRDFDLEYGKERVTSAGENGKKEVTYEVEMINGIVISQKYISEIITKEPVDEQLTIGAKVVLPAGSYEDWMAAAGISSSDYGYVNYIINHESHWNPLARNSYSGATGLCQALPGSKMASAGADWETNPITQLKWCNGYAVGRYGSWANAYQFWVNNKWW